MGGIISKIANRLRELWLHAQIGSAQPVRELILPHLHDLKEVLRLIIHPWLPVEQLSGLVDGNPLTLTLVNVRFFGRSLRAELFDEQPEQRQLVTVPVWRLRTINESAPGDLVLFEGSRYLTSRLARFSGMIMPPGVRHVLNVSGTWEDVHSRFHRSTRYHETRWLRQFGYQFDVSRQDNDMEEFYYEFYLPLMSKRHGELSAPVSIGQAQVYFQHGAVHKVMREGEWVAGSVGYVQDDTFISCLYGVRGGDERLIDEGAIFMCTLGAVRWANEHGCKSVDLMSSGPFTNSGLFQHKRSWGGAISVPPDLHRRLWLKVNQLTPAVERFLVEHPAVTIDKQDRLQGTVFLPFAGTVGNQEIKSLRKQHATPGMGRMVLRSTKWFEGYSQKDIVLPVVDNDRDHGGRSQS